MADLYFRAWLGWCMIRVNFFLGIHFLKPQILFQILWYKRSWWSIQSIVVNYKTLSTKVSNSEAINQNCVKLLCVSLLYYDVLWAKLEWMKLRVGKLGGMENFKKIFLGLVNLYYITTRFSIKLVFLLNCLLETILGSYFRKKFYTLF